MNKIRQDVIKRLVVFSILMENNEGILGKAPTYVEEKYIAMLGLVHPERLLDEENLKKYNEYLNKWKDVMEGMEE